jgi:hypothetical protein
MLWSILGLITKSIYFKPQIVQTSFALLGLLIGSPILGIVGWVGTALGAAINEVYKKQENSS